MHHPGTRVEVRFEAEGGLARRARASLAGPLLMVGSWMMAAVAGSPRLVRFLERRLGRVAERLGRIRIDIEGMERVDPQDQYVVVALHEGFADALALLRLPLDLRFVARDELFDWPALGAVLSAGRHLCVDSAGSASSVRRFFRQVRRVFGDGDSLVVFAQGSILGLEVAFQQGSWRLARRLGVPLLPVVLTGSHRVWEHPYSSRLRFGQGISMRILEPVPAGALDAARFRDIEREMKRLALDGGGAPPRRFVPERDGWWDGYRFEIDADFPELRERVARHRDLGDPHAG